MHKNNKSTGMHDLHIPVLFQIQKIHSIGVYVSYQT